jgi:hypothetical protein
MYDSAIVTGPFFVLAYADKANSGLSGSPLDKIHIQDLEVGFWPLSVVSSAWIQDPARTSSWRRLRRGRQVIRNGADPLWT